LDVLVVASDKGQYALLDVDGGGVDCHDLPGDNEGVAIPDPSAPFAVFTVEAGAGDGRALLQGVDLENHIVRGQWIVDFTGGAVANDGVEGLAYVPSGGEPGFVVGDQTLGEARSGCVVPWMETGANPEVFGCSSAWTIPGFGEVTGLDYDAGRNVLWASSDDDDQLAAVSVDTHETLAVIDLPAGTSPGQEGHTVVGCTVFISADANEDSRKVWRMRLSAP
jgi:hypothetical protein